MARARNIKPGFFKNELLAELEAFDRLLFIGLWCLADREGRLEDRPKRVKMELFPCDAYDVEAGLQALADSGFIRRYTAAGMAVIEIANFAKHQVPHGTERDSTLPDENGCFTVHERGKNGYATGKTSVLTVKPQKANSADPVNALGDNTLNPDSPNPDSLNPEKREAVTADAATPAKPARAERKAQQLPEDFEPNATCVELAGKLGVSMRAELDKFRDHAATKGVTAKDWQAAFRNWIRKAYEFKNKGAPAMPSNGKGKAMAGLYGVI